MNLYGNYYRWYMEKAIIIKKSTKIRLAKFGNKLSNWDSILIDLMNHADCCDRFWEDRT